MIRDEKSNPEIDISEDYVVGLLDYLALPKLSPRSSGSGYRLEPSIAISLRKSGLLAGMVDAYLTDRDINHSINYTDREPQNIEIKRNSSIVAFCNIMQEEALQLADKLNYLESYINRFGGIHTSHDPDLTLSIFKPWAELHPEWENQDSRKYTLDFLKEELGVDQVPEPELCPDPTYPDKITKEYVAGTFDAVGYLALRISERSDYSINYTLAPVVSFTISNPSNLVLPHLNKFFSEQPVSPGFSHKDNRGTINITGVEDIAEFLEVVAPFLKYHYEIALFFIEDFLPAYQDGYHHDKEGFLDCLRAYEEVAGAPASNKFDLEYFEEIWNL